jgi:hypothetical protein
MLDAREFTVLRAYDLSPMVGGSGETGAKEEPMPGKKHLRGVSAKEQREYEHIKEGAQRSGRYGDRAKEVAARTVMKKHKAEGHGKGH